MNGVEWSWEGQFIKITIRTATIGGDAVGFKFDIATAFGLLLTPTSQAMIAALHTAGDAPLGIEQVFIDERNVDRFLQGVSAVLKCFGERDFPVSLKALQIRYVRKLSEEE